MREFLFTLLSLVCVSNCALSPAFAHDPLKPILDCSLHQDNFCIESIIAVLPDGRKVKGIPNGKTIQETRTYAPDSILSANWELYEFAGLKFDGGSVSTMYPRIFYYPLGNQDCFYSPCVQGSEYLEVVLTPGERDPETAPSHFMPASSEACLGKDYKPGSPWPTSFGIKVKFDVELRIPKEVLSHLTSGGLGRGLSDVTISNIEGNSSFSHLGLILSPTAYSAYGCNGPALAPLADFESDQIVYWMWGSADERMKSFGNCESIPSVSVVSNAFWDSFPSWNSQSKSIEVGLSGPHLHSDGSINLVNFQAKITKQLARCLWGIDLTNQSKAQISLSYESSGQKEIQTLSGELVEDTYILNVTGIHLSSPTLSFKLEEPRPLVAAASPAASPSSTVIAIQSKATKSPATKTKIICVKGKIRKQISGDSCPKGFKRAAP